MRGVTYCEKLTPSFRFGGDLRRTDLAFVCCRLFHAGYFFLITHVLAKFTKENNLDNSVNPDRYRTTPDPTPIQRERMKPVLRPFCTSKGRSDGRQDFVHCVPWTVHYVCFPPLLTAHAAISHSIIGRSMHSGTMRNLPVANATTRRSSVG